MRIISSVIVSLTLVSCQNLCDDAYGKYCPEEVGWGVGECLKTVDAMEIGADCKQFMSLHEACKVILVFVFICLQCNYDVRTILTNSVSGQSTLAICFHV